MSFVDDLEARVQQATQNIGNDIKSYIQARVVDPVVKIGEPAKGNLNIKEIQAGQRGENPNATVEPYNDSESSNVMQYALPLVAVVLVAYFVFKSKRRG